MDVYLNEQLAMHVVCTPEHLSELAVGRLLTEGLIHDAGEIECVYICQLGLRAKVMLRQGCEVHASRAAAASVSTCCTDNRTLLQVPVIRPKPLQPILWKREWLFQLLDRARTEEPLYRETHAVHSCYLALRDTVLCCREDIGRHNALDKVIGWAAIHGADTRECMLFTTGRMPSDMVSKAIRARIPVLVSKTYPSDRGVELAKASGLTLATIRPDGTLILWCDGAEEHETVSGT